MDQLKNRIETMGEKTLKIRHKYGKHSRAVKNKKTGLKHLLLWAKKNPLKIGAFLFTGTIIYLSVLFYNYDEDFRNHRENVSNNKTVRGVILPMRILSEISAITINFGGTKIPVSTENLKRGFKISPLNIKNCGSETKGTDPGTADPMMFMITLVDDRLYASASFINLINDRVMGSVNQKNWTFFSKDISAIRTDDYSFEVIDNKGYVNFSMQFLEPDILAINGYFVGRECVYVASDNAMYSCPKTGNYLGSAFAEVKKIKRIW